MPRETKEWIGKRHDSVPPPYIRLRIYRRAEGCCHISGLKIRSGQPWECDHIVALCNGGENRESNMAPALIDKHREKTSRDVGLRAVNDRIMKKSVGIRPKKRTIPGRRFNGDPIPSRWK